MSKRKNLAWSDLFSRESLAHALGGAIGGAIAMSTFYPMDLIRLRRQTRDKSIKENGDATVASEPQRGVLLLLRRGEFDQAVVIVKSNLGYAYQGLPATIASLFTSNFVYFYSYNALKLVIERVGERDVRTLENLGVGAIAGVINVLVTCPLWVANTRLKLQQKGGKGEEAQYKSLPSAVVKIAKEEGVASLWNGVVASLWLVSNPTIHFFVYDRLKRAVQRLRRRRGARSAEFNSATIFLMASAAKVCATLLTYPLQVAQSILRAKKDVKELTTLSVLLNLFKEDGFFGWYKGLTVKVTQTVLINAFQFVFYEKIFNFVVKLIVSERRQRILKNK